MPKTIEFTTSDLQLIKATTELTFKRTAEHFGKLSKVMSKEEAYRAYNKSAVQRAIKAGDIQTVKKGGKTSTVYIIRESFDNWVYLNELSSNPVVK